MAAIITRHAFCDAYNMMHTLFSILRLLVKKFKNKPALPFPNEDMPVSCFFFGNQIAAENEINTLQLHFIRLVLIKTSLKPLDDDEDKKIKK